MLKRRKTKLLNGSPRQGWGRVTNLSQMHTLHAAGWNPKLASKEARSMELTATYFWVNIIGSVWISSCPSLLPIRTYVESWSLWSSIKNEGDRNLHDMNIWAWLFFATHLKCVNLQSKCKYTLRVWIFTSTFGWFWFIHWHLLIVLVSNKYGIAEVISFKKLTTITYLSNVIL